MNNGSQVSLRVILFKLCIRGTSGLILISLLSDLPIVTHLFLSSTPRCSFLLELKLGTVLAWATFGQNLQAVLNFPGDARITLLNGKFKITPWTRFFCLFACTHHKHTCQTLSVSTRDELRAPERMFWWVSRYTNSSKIRVLHYTAPTESTEAIKRMLVCKRFVRKLMLYGSTEQKIIQRRHELIFHLAGSSWTWDLYSMWC